MFGTMCMWKHVCTGALAARQTKPLWSLPIFQTHIPRCSNLQSLDYNEGSVPMESNTTSSLLDTVCKVVLVCMMHWHASQRLCLQSWVRRSADLGSCWEPFLACVTDGQHKLDSPDSQPPSTTHIELRMGAEDVTTLSVVTLIPAVYLPDFSALLYCVPEKHFLAWKPMA